MSAKLRIFCQNITKLLIIYAFLFLNSLVCENMERAVSLIRNTAQCDYYGY